MENNVHVMKAVETQNELVKKDMPLSGYRITLQEYDYDVDCRVVVEFDEVKMFTVNNGFVVIYPNNGDMVAYNSEVVFSIEQLPAKEQN